MSTMLALVTVSPGWMWVALACMLALFVLSSVAAYVRRSGNRSSNRSGNRAGVGLGGHGRDDGDGPAGEAAHRWQALAVVSRLMPRSAGRRWLAEAESLLAEVTDARRGAAVRSYLLSAPRLAAMMWAHVVLRRAQPGPRRPG
jgi:hypothetical protein